MSFSRPPNSLYFTAQLEIKLISEFIQAVWNISPNISICPYLAGHNWRSKRDKPVRRAKALLRKITRFGFRADTSIVSKVSSILTDKSTTVNSVIVFLFSPRNFSRNFHYIHVSLLIIQGKDPKFRKRKFSLTIPILFLLYGLFHSFYNTFTVYIINPLTSATASDEGTIARRFINLFVTKLSVKHVRYGFSDQISSSDCLFRCMKLAAEYIDDPLFLHSFVWKKPNDTKRILSLQK